MTLRVELLPKIASVAASQWDALVADDDPFIEHAFLLALEESASVGGDSGWLPLHVTVRDGARLVAALPLYVKQHSYGEYIFDWSWAAAAERAGIAYYPKLVGMVPFTPATGQRVLLAHDLDKAELAGALARGIVEAQTKTSASSVHLLFLSQEERDLLGTAPFMPRQSLQFHWHNEGYQSFEDYLSRFRSALRKQVLRERQKAQQSGLDIRVIEGPSLTPEDWQALYAFYVDTCQKRGSGPYLTRAFFSQIAYTHAHRVLAVLAFDRGVPVAGTLNFEKGKNLYGRYWGCSQDYPALHFECCYYRLIERAIERGYDRFEAGAQGTHKLRRGLMPSAIHSLHAITHPALQHAIADFLHRETTALHGEIAMLAEHGPFRRG